jgi:hypothetical protein
MAVEGELGLKLGRTSSKILKPGESYTVAPMALHSFFNPTEKEIKYNVKLHPGNTRFENALRILYGLACDGLTDKNTIPKSIVHTAIVVVMSDINLPGFFSYLFPIAKLIAQRAKASGTEQRLIDKYCV